MNDTEVLNYLNQLFKDKPNIDIRFNSSTQEYRIAGNYISASGKTIQEATEAFKIIRDNIRKQLESGYAK